MHFLAQGPLHQAGGEHGQSDEPEGRLDLAAKVRGQRQAQRTDAVAQVAPKAPIAIGEEIDLSWCECHAGNPWTDFC